MIIFFFYVVKNAKFIIKWTNELKQIANMRRIKGYKSISKERLLCALDKSESAGSENNLNNARIKNISEYFNKLRDRFLKPKIK